MGAAIAIAREVRRNCRASSAAAVMLSTNALRITEVACLLASLNRGHSGVNHIAIEPLRHMTNTSAQAATNESRRLARRASENADTRQSTHTMIPRPATNPDTAAWC